MEEVKSNGQFNVVLLGSLFVVSSLKRANKFYYVSCQEEKKTKAKEKQKYLNVIKKAEEEIRKTQM